MLSEEYNLWKRNEYTYVGDDTLDIDPKLHNDFIKNYQKSIFLALVERNLLTPEQYQRCLEELECQREGYLQ